ncbi:putative ubiquitin conjugating enzyme E2, partial [Aspergillus glaucus CBS 516.65]
MLYNIQPSAFRRLAGDHAVLHDDLPPNYLFPPDDSFDDLTQLSILLAGPQGTPYAQGLWRLHLKMPEDYPKSPPKAMFRTRIWHPNVEETTGAVCVDTLKRDWKPELTLRDVLITISCLLIYPNPDSALNSAAGALQQEDYEAFARQAKVMTSIHAPVPADMKSAVMEAKLRGEEAGAVIQEQQEDSRALQTRKGTKVQSVTMKKKGTSQSAQAHSAQQQQQQQQQSLSPLPPPTTDQDEIMTSSDAENENDENNTTESKENDPSLSPSPVKFAPPSPRKNAHGKRPLSVLTMPLDHAHSHCHTHDQTSPPPTMMDTDEDGMMMTASEKNIAANANHQESIPEEDEDRGDASPRRKSPKLSTLNKGVNASGRIRDEIFEDTPPTPSTHHRRTKTTGKEN